MKKKLFTTLAVALMACLAVTVFAGCGGGDKKATAYGLVHNHYVGIATVTLDKNDKVKDVTFDEVLLPYNWAKFTSAANEALDDEIEYVLETTNATNGVTTGYAKYIRVGTANFEASVAAEATEPTYTKIGDNTYNLQTKATTDQAQAKWYVDACMAGNFAILKAGATAGTYTDADLDPTLSGAINKANPNSTYWRIRDEDGNIDPNKGWLGNIKAMTAFVKANGFDYTEADLTKGGSGTPGKVGTTDVVDGTASATVTDFNDYMLLMKEAYDLAKA